jgi:hypothetical protein
MYEIGPNGVDSDDKNGKQYEQMEDLPLLSAIVVALAVAGGILLAILCAFC